MTGVNRQGIAVEYAVNKKEGSQEIWFNYVEGMKLIGVKAASEFGEGDTVEVVYTEAPGNLRRVKGIVLIQKKPKELPESGNQKEIQ